MFHNVMYSMILLQIMFSTLDNSLMICQSAGYIQLVVYHLHGCFYTSFFIFTVLAKK